MKNSSETSNNFYQKSPEEQAACLKQLAKKALQHYDIDQNSTLELLGHRENAVFGVFSKDRYDYHSDDALRSELQWMESLNNYGVPTPPIIRGKNGDTVYVVTVDDVPEARQIDVLEWVPGGPPEEENIVQSFKTLGKLNAKMHQHAENWNLPEGFIRHSWNEEGMLGDNPLWGRYSDLAGVSKEQLLLP